MYGSRRLINRNVNTKKVWGKCGKVIFCWVKYHIVLQALSSLQAYRIHLRIYVKINLSERCKVRT